MSPKPWLLTYLSGRILHSALGWVVFIGALVFIVIIGTAMAHEAVSGMPYPARCCWSPQAAPAGRPGDCDELPDRAVQAVQGGYRLSLMPGDHPMVKAPMTVIVPYPDMEHAEDGKFHVCFRADMTVRCFFGGSSGS